MWEPVTCFLWFGLLPFGEMEASGEFEQRRDMIWPSCGQIPPRGDCGSGGEEQGDQSETIHEPT